MEEELWGDDSQSVYLVLFSDGSEKRGLKIPLTDMDRIFTRPLKGLHAMGYAILGIPGHISLEDSGSAILNAELESPEPEMGAKVFYYVTQSVVTVYLPSVVVPRLVDKTQTHSETGSGTEAFRTNVINRDDTSRYCSLGRSKPWDWCDACHLIPFGKGEKAVNYILLHRASAVDLKPRAMQDPSPHDDVKNGVLLNKDLHGKLDKRELVLIYMPSLYLAAADVKSAATQADVISGERPMRWTWLWLDDESRERAEEPSVVEAEFDNSLHRLNPHPVLLDYIFGVAVLSRWGFHSEALYDPDRGPDLAAPSQATGSPKNLRRTYQNHENQSETREVAFENTSSRGRATSGTRRGMSIEQAEVLMDLLAASSPTGRAYAREQQEKDDAKRASISSWAQDTRLACDASLSLRLAGQ